MTTPFQILQDEWVLVGPIGDHPHALGIQRITEASNEKMANSFNSILAKLGRLFAGAPTFEGHHDIEPDRYPNSRSYGWITQLQNRGKDGLWGRMNWTPEGRRLLQNGDFKFVSPLYAGKPIAHENGRTIYEPVTFKSLALTNEPNLPLPPLANSKNEMNTITEILGLAADATADQILEATRALKTLATEHATLANSVSAEKTRADAMAAELATFKNEIENLRQSAKSAVENFQAERTARIELILANAITSNRIPKADEPKWRADLEKDLPATVAALANTKPALPTETHTKDLGNARAAYDNESTRRTALVAYLADQESKGLTYDEAWAKAKTDRSDIFSAMSKR